MFNLDQDALLNIVRGVKAQAEAALDEVCEVSTAQMEQSAKKNAPWTDRTGNARRTLEGFTDKSWHERYIGVCGNMFYSPALEMLYGKKYAILYPVVQAETRNVLLRLANKVIAVKLRKE